MTIRNDLVAISRRINALKTNLEKIVKEIEKAEKAKPVRKNKPGKTPEVSEPKGLTATDQVLSVIDGSKKGADVATLKDRTGFNEKKIRNILFRTLKEGKIQRVGKGIYTGVK